MASGQSPVGETPADQAAASVSAASTGAATSTATVPNQRMAIFANVNSRSLSLASISSEGSTESHVVEQEDIIALTQDVRSFKDVLSRLRKVYQKEGDSVETIRATSHERLSDVLKILRHILEKYPAIQSNDLVSAASYLIETVKSLNHPSSTAAGDDVAGGSGGSDAHHYQGVEPKVFYEALDGLALAFSSRVSEYLMGDLDSNVSMSSASSKTKSYENLLHSQEQDLNQGNPQQVPFFLPLGLLYPQAAQQKLTYLIDKLTLPCQ